MQNLIVVTNPDDWDLDVAGVQVVQSRDYLADPAYSQMRGVRVFNLARSYRYQRTGYYVSLLAAARGHRPLPDVEAIQDLKSRAVLRLVADDVVELVQRSLASIQSPDFVLSVYFGRNTAKRHDRLAAALFQQFPAPFLRAYFSRDEDEGPWRLDNIETIGVADIPDAHRAFVRDVARAYFARSRRTVRRTQTSFDVAILVDPKEAEPPSDARAIRRFVRAAAQLGMAADVIGPDELGRVAEYDALFLRETTAVNHRTYRAARRAEGLGLVVIDDPASILRCTNKVFLAELLKRHGVPRPRTLIVHRQNWTEIVSTLGFPVVLKQPDSAFSRGVERVDSEADLEAAVQRLLAGSDLVIAQEFIPTDFDWRVGVIAGRPLFASRYHMARSHWQIVKRAGAGGRDAWGATDAVPIDDAPPRVVATAVKAAGLMGNGLYGVDLKEAGGRVVVIEVNDNPNIEAGVEDAVLKDELYRIVMSTILERIRRNKDRGEP